MRDAADKILRYPIDMIHEIRIENKAKDGGQAPIPPLDWRSGKISGQAQADPSTPPADNAGCAQDRLRRVGRNLSALKTLNIIAHSHCHGNSSSWSTDSTARSQQLIYPPGFVTKLGPFKRAGHQN